MGQLSFFTAVYVGGGAIASIIDGEDDTSALSMVSRRQQRRRRQNTAGASSRLSFLAVVALLLCMSVIASAQDVCNCSPIEYTFELKLDAITCPDPPDSITPGDALAYFGPGVKGYTCQAETGLPVKITEAQFIPQDQGGTAIDTQTKSSLELTDGDKLIFTSPPTIPPIVGRVSLILKGVDVNGVGVENRWTIQFTNECGQLALAEGTDFGLVIFRNLVSPSERVCPRVDPTLAPTFKPSPPPSFKPSPPPTSTPDKSYSYSYVRAFAKAGKGTSKTGKSVNSKKGGYSGKSSKGRRILRTDTSESSEHASLLSDQNVEVEDLNHEEELPLRRRRLHG